MSTSAALVNADKLKQLVKGSFPYWHSSYVFAYGSAVFPQKLQKPGKMVDVIFVVEDPYIWHLENMRPNKNRSHYSFLRWGGPRLVSWVQNKMGCGVYFNPYVTLDGVLMKYGVIHRPKLEKDLRYWNFLYASGRLHKPVLELKPPATASLKEALRYNHEAAVRAVLLQKGRTVSRYSLYHGITELSYLGDSRMKVAENPNKTKNIVLPLLEEFDKVYMPILRTLYPTVEIDYDGKLIQDTRTKTRFKHLLELPIALQSSLCRQMMRDPRVTDKEEVMAELSYMLNIDQFIRNSIKEIVWESSLQQTIQGIFTAGIGRSIKYALEKLDKGWQKKQKVEEEDPEPATSFKKSSLWHTWADNKK